MGKLKIYEQKVVEYYDAANDVKQSITGNYLKKEDNTFIIGKSKKECGLYFYDEARGILYEGPKNTPKKKVFSDAMNTPYAFLWMYGDKWYFQKIASSEIIELGIFNGCDLNVLSFEKCIVYYSKNTPIIIDADDWFLSTENFIIYLKDNKFMVYFPKKKQTKVLGKNIIDFYDTDYFSLFDGKEFLLSKLQYNTDDYGNIVDVEMVQKNYEDVIVTDDNMVLGLCKNGRYELFRGDGDEYIKWKVKGHSKVFRKNAKEDSYRLIYDGEDICSYTNAIIKQQGEHGILYRINEDGSLSFVAKGKDVHDIRCLYRQNSLNWTLVTSYIEKEAVKEKTTQENIEKLKNKKSFMKRLFHL